MRTAIVSDLHLGSGSGADLVRRPGFRRRLLDELDGAERIVLLGDVLELRDRPLGEVLDAAAPLFAELGELLDGGELVIVPGNHDHRLAEDWLERRALDGEPRLAVEQRFEPTGPLAALADQAAGAQVVAAYPGMWLRDDVYAMHGHFLDRHLTVPTFERMGVAAVERILGIPPGGPDPLAPPDEPTEVNIEEYERVQAPVYALLYALAQAGVGGRESANPSMRVWAALGGGESRAARLRGWLLGSVALPGAVGVANRLGLGPVRPDLTPGTITRASLLALGEVVERLAIDAEHVIFGHTHRRGPLADDEPGWGAAGARLWNTGSWVHSPGLLRATARESPYWPGTVGFVDDDGPPQLVHVLDDLGRDDLKGDG